MAEAVFIRLLEVEDKGGALLDATTGMTGRRTNLEVQDLAAIPGTPFSYWISPHVRRLFQTFPPFEQDERIARKGLTTSNDERYVRLYWEVTQPRRWHTYAKGGAAAKFYVDMKTVVRWDDGQRTIPGYTGRPGRETDKVECADLMGLPGLTWPLRAASFSPSALPAEGVFSARGYVIIAPRPRLPEILGLTSSSTFDFLFKTSLGRAGHPEFIVGILQRLPFCPLPNSEAQTLARLTHRAWSLKRHLDTRTETSHAFERPALLRAAAPTLAARAQHWLDLTRDAEAELARIQAEIDNLCFALYGITDEDRRSIERGFGSSGAEEEEADHDDEDDHDDGSDSAPEGLAPMVAALVSYTIGVAFGRFDLRLATGERTPPDEPDPFDPLPPCSPGMLTGPDGLPVAEPPPGYPIAFPLDGILVDDPGDPRDLLARIAEAFTVAFPEAADDRLREAADILDPGAGDLRRWLRRDFFADHVARYSKSRRKAPIYWRLGTPSGSYGVWIYLHRFTPDTLHSVAERVREKLRFEEGRLSTLHAEYGDAPAPSQRRTLAAQEALVDELRTLRDELARVTPLWDPDLDDGVILNAAPLHRLFAHTRAWQKECEKAWEKLCAAEYDWAHLALRLWPERVVPKCREDRSLAIAHGLEDALWYEDDAGKWQPRLVSATDVDRLIAERTSPAVKDALSKLGTAPPPPAPKRGGRKPAAPRAPRATTKRSDQLDLGFSTSGADPDALDALRTALRGFPDGAGRAELLAAAGLDEAAWKPAIEALVATGEVEKTGAGRGTRYRRAGSN